MRQALVLAALAAACASSASPPVGDAGAGPGGDGPGSGGDGGRSEGDGGRGSAEKDGGAAPGADGGRDRAEQDASPPPPMGGWSSLPSLPVPRQEMAAAVLRGEVYLIGGYTGGRPETASGFVHSFDPATGTFRARRPLPYVVDHASVAVIGERLYLLGPNDDGQVLVYDPDADTWTARASRARRFTDRHACGVGILEGRAYVAGGTEPRTGGRRELDLFAAYDPERDEWQELPPLPSPRTHLAGTSARGQIVLLGGVRGEQAASADVLSFDPAAGPAAGRWVSRAAMPRPRGNFSVARLGGLLLVLGGETPDVNAGAGALRVESVVDVYDPAADRWIGMVARMAVPRHGMAVAVLGDTIFAAGGATVPGFSTRGGMLFERWSP